MFRSRAAGALIALAAILIVPVAASAQSVTGADVSQWQGTITWNRVAASGIRFVFVKATEGTTYTDPAFARNRDGARSAGLAVGFYHFADPRGSTLVAARQDAAAQAAHFLGVYQPRPTDLRPVLDIEQTGGLSPARLQAWVSTWVKTVRGRLHRQPFIYTSPYFWETYLSNTTSIAPVAGLWLADWTTGSPWLPASNWGGRGWAFWQYSDSGHVDGISGAVDRDRLNGSSLLPYRIGARPAVHPAPAISGAPAVGTPIQTSGGTWRGTGPIALTYRWQRCSATGTNCASIPGATLTSYTPVAADYGKTLRVVVRAANALGATSAASTPSPAVADHTPPSVPVVDSPNRLVTAMSAPAVWAARDDASGVATYDVQTRTYTSAQQTVTSWQAWQPGVSTTSAVFSGQPGTTACFRALATDHAGNTSAWSAQTCVTFPADPRTFKQSGRWRTLADSSSPSGYTERSATRGSALSARRVYTRRIAVLADTCATCGSVTISLGGQVVGTYSLHSAAPAHGVVIATPQFSTLRSGKLEIAVAGAHSPVEIQGVYLQRGL
jgi:GH25 family lysozyme M1 (1,4-beta-N-acetylmuramidase)